jgi:hypothetical protein
MHHHTVGMKVVSAFVLGALLLPAAAQARTSSEVTTNASRQCSALRVEIGPATFGATFSSFSTCILKLFPVEEQNAAAANTLCRVRFPVASSRSRSFDNCVLTVAKSASLTEQQSLNPAHTCTSLRSSIGTAAFASKYGNGNASGVFGTCVSTTARAQLAGEKSSAATCRAEQESAGFESKHGGKTFAQFYGTNAADSNAFGRCVALAAQGGSASQAGQAPASTPGQQSTPQPSSTTTTTPAPTDPCTAENGKPNRLMPNDCPPG